MKSAEEWINQQLFQPGIGIFNEYWIKQIQIEAYKQGASDVIDEVIVDNPVGNMKLANKLVEFSARKDFI